MIKQTIGELLGNNVVLDIEGMDRMYLNLYQPRLQTGGGVVTSFREEHIGNEDSLYRFDGSDE
uniref:Uncharacterized protein n=1 Tax=Candidatus Kentrum sp. FW TaxID=2126338 RepID=A0A450U0H7_9GAMM|nr:MAG: hypothetical protein BECKFW1821C_GA0114237_10899 [Candidatus Kentron sp. FW]